MVRIEMENGGVIELELYPETAPITVKNFEKLVSEGFYDGLIFHRVISGFLDGNYAAFGKVTKGIEVVDAIAAVETNAMDKPYEDQVMKKVTLV